MKRNIKRQFDLGLTGLGIAVIFSAVILGGSLEVEAQLPLALIGVLLMEAGVWGLSSKLFPNERKYSMLRDEGDNMIALIRELNHAAIAKSTGQEDAKRFQATLEKMHDSVVKMADLAAREDGPDNPMAPPKA